MTPHIDDIIRYRKVRHGWVPLPPEVAAETDRDDQPCYVCLNGRLDPIHREGQFVVESHTGDKSIVDKYKVGQEGVIKLEVFVKGDEYVVLLMRDVAQAQQ